MHNDLSWLRGKTLSAVHAEAYTWHFSFSGGAALCAECPWRIISKGGVALGSVDHRQRFGLAGNVDAAREAGSLLARREIIEARIRPETCDLTVDFAEEVRLELFNGSAGYEGWNLSSPDGRRLVAQGGGRLTVTQ